MSLTPTPVELRARALTDLRMGLPIVIDMAAPVMVCAVETLSQDRLNDLRALGKLEMVVTRWRADTLKINVYDTDIARIAVPRDANAQWCRAVADPTMDMEYPMKGPFQSQRGGNTNVHRAAIAHAKAAQLLPAAIMVTGINPMPGLTMLPTEIALNPFFSDVISAPLPLAAAEAGRLHVFRPDGGGDEHYVMEIGNPKRNAPVLTRLHSACFTGDVLGSLKCDCGPQLNSALAEMGKQGAGVLLYLNQEGRGIGLANKMRAYELQHQGFDTVQANHRLGFEDDERDFRIGAELLKKLGFSQIRLMTNNPKKIDMLQGHGLDVTERVPLVINSNIHNHAYLKTKATKSGHFL